MKLLQKTLPVYVKVIDETLGQVEAFVAGIGNVDEVKDRIMPGAFNESLKLRNPKGVWAHDWTQPIAKTLEAGEVPAGDPRLPGKLASAGAGGLRVLAQFNLDTPRGRDAFSDVKFFGDEQEWSIGYIPEETHVDPKTGVRDIIRMGLFEYSPVLFGANSLTQTGGMKSAIGEKIVPGSQEARQEALLRALSTVENEGDGEVMVIPIATFDDSITYYAWDWRNDQEGTYRRTYARAADDAFTFGERESVQVVETIVSGGKTLEELRARARKDHEAKASVSDASWDGASSRFADDEWKRACAACRGESDAPKTDCFLPHHEPDGTINRNGVHAAAGRYSQVTAPAAAKEKASAHLRGHYKNDLSEDVPETLKSSQASDEKTGGCTSCEPELENAEAAVKALEIVSAAMPLLRTKSGRVLAKRNEDRLRTARDHLNAVLAELDAEEADEEKAATLSTLELMRFGQLKAAALS